MLCNGILTSNRFGGEKLDVAAIHQQIDCFVVETGWRGLLLSEVVLDQRFWLWDQRLVIQRPVDSGSLEFFILQGSLPDENFQMATSHVKFYTRDLCIIISIGIFCDYHFAHLSTDTPVI